MLVDFDRECDQSKTICVKNDSKIIFVLLDLSFSVCLPPSDKIVVCYFFVVE